MNKSRYRYFETSIDEINTIDELSEHLYSLLVSSTTVYFDEDEGNVLHEIKALIEKFDGLKIEIYSKEHPPPHFHVIYGELKASFSLDDCRCIEGKLSKVQVKKVEYWFNNLNGKIKLIDFWNKTRPYDCVVGKYTEV